MIELLLAAAERPDFDPNAVTPGWVGFTATFLVAAVILLLAFDLVRRVRRTTYRSQIREKLEQERAEQQRAAADEPDASGGRSQGTEPGRGESPLS